MSKFAIIALGVAMTAGYAQTPPPTTPTTGANTTGTSNAGATVPQQRQPSRSPKPTTAATGANTTGTSNTGATTKASKQGSRKSHHKQQPRHKSESTQR